MSRSEEPPCPPTSGPVTPREGIRSDADKSTDADATQRRDLELESTEPSTRLDHVEAEVLNYVHLDPPGTPGSIGRIAHYEVFNVVGRGAMGLVVRAYDTQLCRTVAIKLMSPQLTLNRLARERFFREARAAAGINHTNIVTIHAVSEHAGVPFLVMEFVGGRSLSDRIHSEAPLSCLDALRISVQIATGLTAAHSQGIIHRDIKPANIMLEDSIERVKITDFGLARVMMEHSELTSQGGVVGTPAYMSPEQVNGDPLDQRSDLFSLGCVMYAMTAGYSPFRGENALGTARRVASVKHESLAAISKDVPPYFVQIVDRLLEKTPADRYQSASELVEDLTGHLVRANRGVGPHVDIPALASTPARSRSARWVALTLLFLAATAAVLAAFRHRSLLLGSGATPQGVASLPTEGVRILRVAQHGPADFASIGQALGRATPGTIIRVEDSGVYDEPLNLLGSSGTAGVHLETTAGATLKSAGNRPVLTLDGVAGANVSGFRIEAAGQQHAIELRGYCPGVVIENCEIACSAESSIAAVYLHGGARGAEADPIHLRRLRIECGLVGLVMGGLDDTEPVRLVQFTESLVRGPGRDQGVLLVLQVGVRQVAVRGNLFSTGAAGISLALDTPHSAAEVVVAQNSLGNLHYALTFNKSSPEQGILIEDNLIVDTSTLQVGEPGIDAFASWFRSNWWERSPDLEEALAARVAALKGPLPLLSRQPAAADYLKPTPDAPLMPGRTSPRPSPG